MQVAYHVPCFKLKLKALAHVIVGVSVLTIVLLQYTAY